MPTILGANSVSGYDISNSLAFNDASSETLDKNFSSDGDRQKFTWSAWIKRSALAADMVPFGAAEGSGRDEIRLNSNDKFQVFLGDASDANLITTRVFRDVSAWYHFVVAVDTTQGTAANRIKVYVNGVQESAFDTETYPDQNYQMDFTADCEHNIGAEGGGASLAFDGYMSEVNFVDGTQLTPSSFGETNDNNVWVPKLISGISYGTNGFFLQFKQTGTSANAAGIGADTSGNNHHMTVTNLTAIDIVEDTPTNNFATMNSLIPSGSVAFSDSNLVASAGANAQRTVVGTIAVSSGKWYWETLWTEVGGNDASSVGIVGTDNMTPNGNIAGVTNSFAYLQDGRKQNSSAVASYGTRFENSHIVGTALNLDDGTITFYLNGSSQGEAYDNISTDITYYLAAGFYNSGSKLDFNFGNPRFAISSGNSDGLYGNFEYAPPAGYYALCTKRLAQFG